MKHAARRFFGSRFLACNVGSLVALSAWPAGLVLVLIVLSAAAQPQNAGGTEPPVVIRREYVAADRIEEYLVDKGRYLEIDGERVEALLRAAGRAQLPARAATHISEARYVAELDSAGGLSGSATLDFERAAEGGALLPWGDCTLAVTGAKWRDVSPTVAKMGVARDGRQTILVPQSARLELDWSLEGHREGTTTRFDLRLPLAVVSTMQLELPADVEVSVEGAIVDAQVDTPRGRRWTLRFAAGAEARLRLSPRPPAAEDAAAITRFRRRTSYRVTAQGVAVTVRCQLDSAGPIPRELIADLDSDARVVAARLNDRQIGWTTRNESDSSSRQVRFHLPPQLGDHFAQLEVELVGSSTIGPPRELPQLRFSRCHWTGGEIALRVTRPLLLAALQLSEARQVRAPTPSVDDNDELVEIIEASADARCKVSLQQRIAQAEIRSRLELELGEQDVRGRLTALVQTTEGSVFELVGELPRLWRIDSVRADVETERLEWEIEVGRDGEQQVRIQIPSGISPARPLRLELQGHWARSPLDQSCMMDDLRMVTFPGTKVRRRLVSIVADEQLELAVEGADELSLREAATLRDREFGDFAAREQPLRQGGLVFLDDENAQSLRVKLRGESASFAAENRVDVVFEPGRVRETFRIVCTPESTPIDRLRVHCSRRRNVPLAWFLEAANADPVPARRLSPEEMELAGLSLDGEAWELELPRAMTERFEVVARRTLAVEGNLSVGLAVVPDATNQLGVVTLHAGTGTQIWIDNRDLTPIPASSSLADAGSGQRAAYRYEPLRHAQYGVDSQLDVAITDDAAAFAWNGTWVSRLHEDGNVSHALSLRIENTGLDNLDVVLPEEGRARAIYVDGKSATNAGDRRLTIALPRDRRYCKVQIRYDESRGPLGMFARLRSQDPDVGIPVLAWRRVILTPPGYEVVSAPGASRPRLESRTLYQRLLGPLAVGEGLAMPAASSAWASDSSESVSNLGSSSGENPLLMGAAGWSVYRGQLRPTAVSRYTIVDRRLLENLSWVLLIAVATILILLAPRRRVTWGSLLFGAGLLAAYLPHPYAILAGACFVGAIVAGVVGLFRQRGGVVLTPTAPQASHASDAPEGSTVLRGSSLLGAIAVALAVPLSGGAAEADGEPPAPIANRLVIPIDENRRPVGNTYFVPEELYEFLVRRAGMAEQPRADWLITRTVYRANLDPAAAPVERQLGGFVAQIDLETFADQMTVVLPFRREEARLRGPVMLDGLPVETRWRGDGDGLAVVIQRRGTYRLVLPLTPATRALNALVKVDLRVPAAMEGRFDLSVGTQLDQLKFNGRPIVAERGANSGELRLSFGPAKRLTLSWPDARSETRWPEFDRTTHLRFQPEGVFVDAVWQTTGRRRLPRQFVVRIDPRLRLLTETGRDFEIQRESTEPGSVPRYRVRTAENSAGLNRLQLAMKYDEATPFGEWGLPEIATEVATSRRTYALVSVDPNLKSRAVRRDRLALLDRDDWPLAWPADEPFPDFAFRVTEATADFQIAVRPPETRTTYECELALGFEARRTRVELIADLETESGQVLQHRLLVPEGFEASSVSLTRGDVDQMLRWSQAVDGVLTIFLARPLSGTQRLYVAGTIGVQGELRELPLVRLENAQLSSGRLALFRRDDVIVDVEPESQLEAIEGLADRLLSLVELEELAFGRPIGVYDFKEDSRAKLRVRGNHPVIRGEQITRLNQQQGDWDVAVECRFQVDAGTVGSLRFELPPSLADPIVIEPNLPYRLVELPNSQTRRLIVYPEVAVAGEFQLEIRAPLEFSAGDRVRVPDVRVAEDVEMDRTIIMPRQVEGQAISWEVRHLQPLVRSPTQLRVRVVGEAFSAAVTAVAPRRGDPQVRLAHVQTVMLGAREYFAVAAFDLEPAGRQTCRLEMPRDCEVRGVQVAGLPAVRPSASDPLIVNLGSEQLPHRIEIVYEGRAQLADGELRLIAPELYDLGTRANPLEGGGRRIENERSTWTISHAADGEHVLELGGGDEIMRSSSLQRDLEHLSTISDLIADVTSEEPSEVLAIWYRRWARRMDVLRERIELNLAGLPPGESRRSINDRLQDVRQQQLVAARRFAMPESLNGDAELPEVADRAEIPGEALEVASNQLVLGMRGAPGAIELRQRRATRRPWYVQIQSLAAVGLLALAGTLVMGGGYLADLIWRWPHAVCLVGGIVLALAWTPAAIGIAAAGVSVYLAVRYPLARQHLARR
ncbi:MAG: hypothetical protein DWQ31_11320 [Planctomycetota bacterium]|nr:MAG: hypothetical protein DWQ31_11320 [Planctomycetota bacterium]